jgi:hypothetical protein
MCPVFDHFPQKNVRCKKEMPLTALLFEHNFQLHNKNDGKISKHLSGGKSAQGSFKTLMITRHFPLFLLTVFPNFFSKGVL